MLKKIKLDYILVLYILIFMIISVSTIYSANTYLPKYLGNLALKQSLYYLLGFILIFLIIRFSNYRLLKLIDFLYIINVILLFLLLFIGKSINGSKCWFIIPYIGSFQVSEFMKMFIVLKLSQDLYIFFNRKSISVKDEFIFILKELVIVLIPAFLTFLEPDTGLVIMYLFASLIMFLVSPFHKRWIIIFMILGISIISVFIYLYFFNQDLFIKLFSDDIFYRIERIINWKNGEGMQLENSLTAIGSSYYFGHGYNKTPLYFPESGTDFIFSVFANNFGLLGSIMLVLFILSFDIYLLLKVRKCKLIRSKMIIIGTVVLLVYQQVQNISMTLGILPITGITLPFISYGGSSLLSYLFMMAIIINIDKEKHNHLIDCV